MPSIPVAKQREIARLHKGGLSYRAIAKRVGVHFTVVGDYVRGDARPAAPLTPEQLEESIRAALRRGHAGEKDLAKDLGITLTRLRGAVRTMQERGVMIVGRPGGILDMAPVTALEPGRHEIKGTAGEWTHHFGVTSDNHLCNRHSRLDVLKAAYDHFERVGIKDVFNCGNWIDGEAPFNKTELIVAPGMESQLDYLVDNWPARKGITTHFIAGDDHEGWYTRREGVEIGKRLEQSAREQGRHDLHYLGYAECDIALVFGRGAAVMRVVHPGGGSAYAISYTDQKRTESYQGGEKPHIELVGHYHKFNQGYPREVHTVQCGCTCDQTLFMRKKRLQAHVGFVEVKIKQDNQGAIERFAVEWFPFFDRGYYERRFR